MRGFIIAAIAALVFSANAAAAEPRLLHTGDVLDVINQGDLSLPRLRVALRDYGYHGFSQGDHFGHIIKITAVGPDKLIYRLKVHMKTYEVTHVRRIRHTN